MDISTLVLQNVDIPSPRQLNSKHGEQVKRYRAQLYKTVTEQGIPDALAKLEQIEVLNRWKKKHTKHLLQIDRDVTQAMLSAENTSRPAHTAPWSPKIKIAYDAVHTINQQLKKMLPKRVHHLRDTQTTDNETLTSLWKQRIHALKHLQALRQDAAQLRKTFLEEAADIYELTGNTKREQIIQNIQSVEELRRTYGHIRYVTKSEQNRHGLTQVSYPTTEG